MCLLRLWCFLSVQIVQDLWFKYTCDWQILTVNVMNCLPILAYHVQTKRQFPLNILKLHICCMAVCLLLFLRILIWRVEKQQQENMTHTEVLWTLGAKNIIYSYFYYCMLLLIAGVFEGTGMFHVQWCSYLCYGHTVIMWL